MMRPVVRDIDIITHADDINKEVGALNGPKLLYDVEEPLVDPLSSEQVDLYFVSANGSVAGTGTQENPMTIAQAETTSGTSDIIFLLNDDGNIDVNTISVGTLTLKPYQQLLGVGDSTSQDILLPNNNVYTVSSTTGRPSLMSPVDANIVKLFYNNKFYFVF